MIKKEAIAIIFVVIILTFSALASAVGDVAYIYKRSFGVDHNVISALNEIGLSVDLINEASLPRDLSSYKMIFVGDERFTKKQFIPINDMPSVITNSYHTSFWGFTDGDGVSQLAASHPLSVNKNGNMIQVYTQARFSTGGVSIPYYYLDVENKDPSLDTIALTETTSSGSDFGDVISSAEVGDHLLNGKTQNAKMCFFGIVESKYWTPQARQLFADCVESVVSECFVDNDCPASHFNGAPFCQNGDVYKSQTSYTCEQITQFSQCVPADDNVLVEDCLYGCDNGVCLQPTCTENSDCGIDGFIGNNFCSTTGNVVRTFKTFTCNNPGTLNSFCSSTQNNQLIDECLDVCVNGACEGIVCDNDDDCNDFSPLTIDYCVNPGTVASVCQNIPINCASNSDCGVTGFIGNEFCSANDVTKNFQTATCLNAGTANSSCSIGISTQTIQQCEFACYLGSCIECDSNSDCDDGNSSTTDICQNPGTLNSFCVNQNIECFSESDCGTDGFVGGNICSQQGDVVKTFVDYTCNNQGTPQSYCSSTQNNQLVQDCSFSCVAGTCVACNSDSQCNDNNPLTVDSCTNPGTSISQCQNVPINCASDIDCGVTGFIGNEFCSANDVVKNYQSSTCNNPGSTNSFCDIEVTSQVVNSCQFACSNGSCIACDSNNDCDDGNSNTFDLCNNPGTLNSFCTNNNVAPQNISCSNDLDCGSDSVISVNFCSADDISRLVMGWTCNNPGTSVSYCSSGIESETITICPQFCSNGQCVDIECFNHADCNDNDAGTIDICNNPGTPSSFCTNNPLNIICSNDNDCGIDSQVNGNICVGNSVTNLFQEFTCNNAGTINSFCSSELTQSTITTCAFACSNGACVPAPPALPVCGNNVLETGEGCDDGNLNNGDGCSSNCQIEVPSCVNACANGARQCLNTNDYRVCADFNGDGCTEWSATASCGFGLQCSGGFCS